MPTHDLLPALIPQTNIPFIFINSPCLVFISSPCPSILLVFSSFYLSSNSLVLSLAFPFYPALHPSVFSPSLVLSLSLSLSRSLSISLSLCFLPSCQVAGSGYVEPHSWQRLSELTQRCHCVQTSRTRSREEGGKKKKKRKKKTQPPFCLSGQAGAELIRLW